MPRERRSENEKNMVAVKAVGEVEEGGMEEGGMEEAGARVNRDAREAGVTTEQLERLGKVLALMRYASAQTPTAREAWKQSGKRDGRNDLKLIFTPTKACSLDIVYLNTSCGGYGKHTRRL
jgi:uncharacterized protein with von Willebrand factor type A (vWA) domain